MPQPYDLSGLATAQATVAQMVNDQTVGTTKFAGGAQSWLTKPQGVFLAVVAVGGGLVPTTTNNVRAMLTNLKYGLDLLDAGAGASATSVTVTSVAAYASPSAVGGTPQATKYDLSGLAAAQAALTNMLADQRNGVTDFVHPNPFQAVMSVGAVVQNTTMGAVRNRLAALRAMFDQLAQ